MDTGTIDAGVWKSAPGKGRKTPKGRQASDKAIAEVQALLGSRPRERQLLIEFLHLIQDFYAHSNWVENAGFSMLLAPIEAFSWLPPPANLQTGLYPEYVSPPSLQLDCYLFPVEDWGLRIHGATHGCMNKDSERQFRGITVVPGSPGITYHRLAAEYAKLHSVEFLNEMAKANPWFKTCFRPPYVGGVDCSGGVLNL